MNNADASGETVRTQYDWSTNSPSMAVITAIAVIENIEPTDLQLTLYDYIDPESLDDLVATGSDISVSFSVDEYQVQIEGNELLIT